MSDADTSNETLEVKAPEKPVYPTIEKWNKFLDDMANGGVPISKIEATQEEFNDFVDYCKKESPEVYKHCLQSGQWFLRGKRIYVSVKAKEADGSTPN